MNFLTVSARRSECQEIGTGSASGGDTLGPMGHAEAMISAHFRT
jgi:hypothetical protein